MTSLIDCVTLRRAGYLLQSVMIKQVILPANLLMNLTLLQSIINKQMMLLLNLRLSTQ